ncbi:ABC transporter substrate-binding protein [Micromonospora sp. NPDC048871]|uniref:ABC transporter substrate-binding protein n=1 Tax=unclassified Micromonospora TaxID=2617518 RepID=UPI002E0D9B0D|nr:extracellular solute-binding protein [Micromonospora sp. NBC_01739]
MRNEASFRLSRRGLLTGALGFTGALALGACASREGDTGTPGATTGAQTLGASGMEWDRFKGETLNLLLCEHWWTSAVSKRFSEFEALTGMKIKANTLSEDSYYQQALVALSSGATTYDALMVGNLQAGQYMNAGWLEPLDTYFGGGGLVNADWFDTNDFFAPARKASSLNGELMALPLSAEAGVVIYRKDLATQAGINGFPTQESLVDASAKLSAAMERPFAGRGRRGLDIVWTWTNFFLTQGGEFYNGNTPTVDSPEAVAATELYVQQLLTKYGPKGASNMSWLEATGTVNEGRAALYTDASGLLSVVLDKNSSKHTDQIAVSRWPGSAAAKAAPNYWYWMAGIPKASRKKEQAALFYAWAMSKETATSVSSESGSPSARESVWSNEDFLSFYPGDMSTEIVANLQAVQPDRVPYARPTFPSEADALSLELIKVLVDGKDPKRAMADAAAAMARAGR